MIIQQPLLLTPRASRSSAVPSGGLSLTHVLRHKNNSTYLYYHRKNLRPLAAMRRRVCVWRRARLVASPRGAENDTWAALPRHLAGPVIPGNGAL
ncbi:hypothetical protein E2C01_063715 [Portunus trituberculatus]|uniref:Uncharacterized protein n=1 Tax=Portunus trituberculatus TaxID=210409 RepID=A0A5B7HIE0_PORTR|nr:hypothetical protein [Portunus trituberculatus]